MSLLCSDKVELKGRVCLNTTNYLGSNLLNIENELVMKKKDIEEKIAQAQMEYENILARTEEEKNKILEVAKKEAIKLEKKAYEEGYIQGQKNGYEDGYKESYEENVYKAQVERDEMLNYANEILEASRQEVNRYIEDSKEDILNISINIAEHVLREKFEEVETMKTLLESVLEEYKVKKGFTLKVSPKYNETLRLEVSNWKLKFNIKDDIFILPDSLVGEGNAVIEDDKGRILVGIDSILDRIKGELL